MWITSRILGPHISRYRLLVYLASATMLSETSTLDGDRDEHVHLAINKTTRVRGRSHTRTLAGTLFVGTGRRGHLRKRCFHRMRQQRRRQPCDLHLADASRYASSSVTMHHCALFECLLLDTGALYHVIPHPEWYCRHPVSHMIVQRSTLQLVMWQALVMYALYLQMVHL